MENAGFFKPGDLLGQEIRRRSVWLTVSKKGRRKKKGAAAAAPFLCLKMTNRMYEDSFGTRRGK